MAVLTQDMAPDEGVENIVNHDHSSGGTGKPIATEGLADKAVTAAKIANKAVGPEQIADQAVTREKIPDGTITREKIADGVLSSSGAIGLKNYIADGLKFAPAGEELNLPILPGRANVEEEIQVLSSGTNLALDARMTSLIYLLAQANGVPIVGKKNAEYPAADEFVVGRWDMNDIFLDAGDGKAKIRDTSPGGVNHLVINGTVSEVDGWIGKSRQGDGNTGHMVSTNSNAFPVGVNERELRVFFTVNSISITQQKIFSYGSGSGNAVFSLRIDNTRVKGDFGTSIVDTGFDVEIGKAYMAKLQYDGAKLYLFINGVLIFTYEISINTLVSSLYLLRDSKAVGGFSSCNIHYCELRNKISTAKQAAQIANKLILPCRYTDTDGKEKTIVDDLLPAGSISLGMVRTNSTKVVEYNDLDYKYGRREGAIGGNRKVFLGWKYFSSSNTFAGVKTKWNVPFDTNKYKIYPVYSTNLIDLLPVNPMYYSSGYYGYYEINRLADSTEIYIGNGGIVGRNGNGIAIGHIGLWAEVIE